MAGASTDSLFAFAMSADSGMNDLRLPNRERLRVSVSAQRGQQVAHAHWARSRSDTSTAFPAELVAAAGRIAQQTHWQSINVAHPSRGASSTGCATARRLPGGRGRLSEDSHVEAELRHTPISGNLHSWRSSAARIPGVEVTGIRHRRARLTQALRADGRKVPCEAGPTETVCRTRGRRRALSAGRRCPRHPARLALHVDGELEAEVGHPLFTNTKDGEALTPAGVLLLDEAKRRSPRRRLRQPSKSRPQAEGKASRRQGPHPGSEGSAEAL